VIWTWLVGPALAWDAIGPVWPEMPVPYTVSNDLSGLEEQGTLDAIEAAFEAYNNVECARIRFDYLGRTNQTFGTSDGENTVSFVGTAWPDDPARATSDVLKFGGGSIVEADIALNLEHHSWVLDNADGVETLDVQAGITREIGRLLGLWDSLDPEATQNPILAGDPEGRTLADDDVEGLCTLYPSEEGEGGGVPLGGSCTDSAECDPRYQCISDAGEQYCAPVCPGGLCPADFLCFDGPETPVCTKAGCGCATGASSGTVGLLLVALTLAARRPTTGGCASTGTRRG
jgi:hypothetical protein